ncbi:MAG: DUF2306 domain-containing protein [Anaeromyxobacter sp.]
MTARAKQWRGPLALVALSLVPAVAGTLRLAGLATGAEPTAGDARFAASPLPVALHVACAIPYCLLGAFQFHPGLRTRWPAWHRRAGRVLAVAGLAAAVSGVWMAIAYPIPLALQGPLLLAVRVVVGLAMAGAIVLGVVAILRRDVAGHERWMVRAYALGQGAGTQVLVLGPGLLLLGDVVGPARDLLMTLAWAINAAVAEHLLRTPRVAGSSPSRSPSPAERMTS